MKAYTYSAKHEVGEGIWMPVNATGAVYLIKENKESLYVGNLYEKGNGVDNFAIAKVIVRNDKVLFFSRNTYSLWTLDKKTMNITYFEYCKKDNTKVLSVEENDEYAWIYPNKFENADEQIMSINLETLEVRTIDINYDSVVDKSPITRLQCYKDELIFATREESKIRVIRINCKSQNIFNFSIDDARFVNCIYVDDDGVWVLYLDGFEKTRLALFSQTGEIILSYDLSINIIMDNSLRITIPCMVKRKDRIVFVHADRSEIDVIELQDGGKYEISKIQYDMSRETKQAEIVFNDIDIEEDGFYVYSPAYGFIKKYLWGKNEVLDLLSEIGEEEVKKSVLERLNKGAIVNESRMFSLDTFIGVI